jgi:hypothetical protein
MFSSLRHLARGSIVGWGTMLQAGRSPIRVPDEVDFSIYLILPATLWPWGRLSLQQKWVPGIFLVVKSGRLVELTTMQPSVSRMSENMGTSTSRNPKGLHGLYKDNYLYPRRPERLWCPTNLLSNGYRGLFPREVKRPGRETDHSPPASDEVKKMWIYTSTPLYAFMR